MIIECSECGARNEVSILDLGSVIKCRCSREMPAPSRFPGKSQILTGPSSVCSRCGRLYDPGRYRSGTEILCTCGNVLAVSSVSAAKNEGRRREDQERVLQQEELVALIEVCKLMNAAVDTDSLLRTIIKLAASILRSSGTTILVKSETGNELIFHVSAGDKADQLRHVRIDADTGVAGWVVRNGRPAIVNNVPGDERFNPQVDQATDYETKSILCVPLRAKERVVGALEAVNKRSPDGFSKRDMALAEALASQAGEAMVRAQLVEEGMRAQRLATIGETVAGLAHGIKNILNGLQGGAYMVNAAVGSGKPEGIEQGWRIVEKNIGLVSDLALNMLSYSKDRKPVMERTDLNETVRHALGLLKEKARSLDVSLVLEPGSSVAPFFFDEQAVQQCILNLLSNAIDACAAKGGKVTVRSRVSDDKWVELAIEDDGCGMSPDVKDKLFTSFFSTKGSKGTGLGLTVTRKILREHGGDVLVESEDGRGSTFTCRLPFRK